MDRPPRCDHFREADRDKGQRVEDMNEVLTGGNKVHGPKMCSAQSDHTHCALCVVVVFEFSHTQSL